MWITTCLLLVLFWQPIASQEGFHEFSSDSVRCHCTPLEGDSGSPFQIVPPRALPTGFTNRNGESFLDLPPLPDNGLPRVLQIPEQPNTQKFVSSPNFDTFRQRLSPSNSLEEDKRDAGGFLLLPPPSPNRDARRSLSPSTRVQGLFNSSSNFRTPQVAAVKVLEPVIEKEQEDIGQLLGLPENVHIEGSPDAGYQFRGYAAPGLRVRGFVGPARRRFRPTDYGNLWKSGQARAWIKSFANKEGYGRGVDGLKVKALVDTDSQQVVSKGSRVGIHGGGYSGSGAAFRKNIGDAKQDPAEARRKPPQFNPFLGVNGGR